MGNEDLFSTSETERILDCLAYEYRDDPDALFFIEYDRGNRLSRASLTDLRVVLSLYGISSEQDWRDDIGPIQA